jgi:ubiquinone biosynthesis protein
MTDDRAHGAFTEAGPWTIDPDAIAWRTGLDELRTRTHAQVPGLIRRRRIPPLRGARVAAKLARATVPWAVANRKATDAPGAQAALAARLRPVFEQLGTTYIKLGQVLASAEGMLPIELVAEFKQCRDRVPAESFDHVRSVIEEDLGADLASIFDELDPVPLAAASIAQVHAGRLRSGEEVVVKVQRPGIAEVVARDLAVLAWVAPLAERRMPNLRLANLPAYIELFAETIVEELDFRLEAENMLDVARVLATVEGLPVVVPRPHPAYVTRRVLVMERMRGLAVDDDAGILAAGIDPMPVFRALMVMLIEGALVHGVFHGDLHGGNMLVLPDGTVSVFDFGITGRLTDRQRQGLVGFLMSALSRDTEAQLRHFQAMGGFDADADLEAIAAQLRLDELVAANEAGMSPEELATVMQDTIKGLVACGARLPKPLFLYSKNNVYLNGAVAALAPDLDVIAELGSVVEAFTTTHAELFRDELGLDLTTPDFAGGNVSDFVRTQLGTDRGGLTSAEVNALQNERLRGLRPGRRR